MVKRVKLPTVQEMERHVEDLARAFRVVLVVEDRMQHHDALSLHLPGLHSVMIKPVRDEASYAVALHELGHCVHPNGSIPTADEFERERLLLFVERNAWEWAEANALDWTVTMEHVKVLCLEGYERRDAVRRRVEAAARGLSPEQRAEALRRFLKKVL